MDVLAEPEPRASQEIQDLRGYPGNVVLLDYLDLKVLQVFKDLLVNEARKATEVRKASV